MAEISTRRCSNSAIAMTTSAIGPRSAGRIIDWADADENMNQCDPRSATPVTAAAEDISYQLLKKPYFRKNAAFDSLEELHLVRGIGDNFWATFVDPEPEKPKKRVMTVWGQGAVNVNTANEQTLLLLACAYAVPQTKLCNDLTEMTKFLAGVRAGEDLSLRDPGVRLRARVHQGHDRHRQRYRGHHAEDDAARAGGLHIGRPRPPRRRPPRARCSASTPTGSYPATSERRACGSTPWSTSAGRPPRAPRRCLQARPVRTEVCPLHLLPGSVRRKSDSHVHHARSPGGRARAESRRHRHLLSDGVEESDHGEVSRNRRRQ